MSDFRRVGDQRIHELLQLNALAEVKLGDVNQAYLYLAVALPRILHVEQPVQLLEPRLAKILQRDAQLHWSVITAVHLVQATVEVRLPFIWHVWLE